MHSQETQDNVMPRFFPLSQSPIWDQQRAYFNTQGIEAWRQNIVPNYITSNPFIANSYAQMALAFIRDTERTFNGNQPIYILELGAGSGRFSYHFLRSFFEAYGEERQRRQPVCYVMTDISQANIEFWEEHEQLKTYVVQGKLDFASFNPVVDDSVYLKKATKLMSKDSVEQPLVYIANYFFDSIEQDVFEVRDGMLYKCLVALKQEKPKSALVSRIKADVITKFLYQDQRCEDDPYDNPQWNQLLARYEESLENTTLLFPVAGLRCLEQLKELSRGRLLMLTADRGQHCPESLTGLRRPQPSPHGGCFSLSVNYHALGCHVQRLGGVALQPFHLQRSISVNAFVWGLGEFTNMREAYHRYVQDFGPDDFYAIKKGMEPQYPQLSLPQLRSLLRLSRWDSNILMGCHERLLQLLSFANKRDQDEFKKILQLVEDQHFFINEKNSPDYALGRLYSQLGDKVRAAHHYRQVR